ncbi:MAG: tetratricopeptide repeat protein [Planctomycetota bacterium]
MPTLDDSIIQAATVQGRQGLVRSKSLGLVLILLLATLIVPTSALAASYSEAETLFRNGEIAEAEALAAAEVERGIWNRSWWQLLIRCQMRTGKYAEALETYEEAIRRYPTSVPLRAIGIDVANFNQLPERAAEEAAVIDRYLQTGQLAYANSETRIAAGRYFSKGLLDARIILKSFYDRVLESDPDNLEALIATAELAIDKGDFAIAADTIQKAKRQQLEDARLDYLLARALEDSDRQAANASLTAAIAANPSYEPSLLMKAELEFDRENFVAAESTLEKAIAINPLSPLAHALLAAIAHVRGDFEKEKALREKALLHWRQNPEVDHFIGRKLSDQYRFAEGAAYQRRAITFDPKHIAANFQLAQDLLRLGDTDVGWELADQVGEQDPYNVVAYNLLTLKDRLDGFETFRIEGDIQETILIRMDKTERAVYGDAVARLLAEARDVLCEKYELELVRPVIVEIFPKQNDFAIRTFGLPGGDGFLGVCFGSVITANSPASQGPRPSNWESVIWHEFCHVVTLNKTKNRMPRWLSEGISVYEERQRDPRWGQSMNAEYRMRIMGEGLTPISALSGAFLNASSAMDVQFAYYESSLVVEFLIDKYGLESVRGLLDALAKGKRINEALAETIAPIERLEQQFTEFARTLAMEFGTSKSGEVLTFDRPDWPPETKPEEKLTWATGNLDNYWARRAIADLKLSRSEFTSAIDDLSFLVEHRAETAERGGVLEQLVACYTALNQSDKELSAIESLLSRSPDALPSMKRLIEIRSEESDWEAVLKVANSAIEVQPFDPDLHWAIVRACDQLGRPEESLGALTALEAMDPVDVAGLHFQFAKAFQAAGEPEKALARTIDALLIAPRYREAHAFLLELESADE